MQSNLARKLEKIFEAFGKIGKLPRNIIKYGAHAFLALFIIGTIMVVYNRTVLNYDLYLEFIATSIIKTSFTVLAETTVGGLVIDFIFGEKGGK